MVLVGFKGVYLVKTSLYSVPVMLLCHEEGRGGMQVSSCSSAKKYFVFVIDLVISGPASRCKAAGDGVRDDGTRGGRGVICSHL